jgi:hypothetical protein
MVRLLAFLLAVGLADGQSAQPEVQTEPLKADDIMAGVAANQDRSGALRKEYVYKQQSRYPRRASRSQENNQGSELLTLVSPSPVFPHGKLFANYCRWSASKKKGPLTAALCIVLSFVNAP